MTWWSSEQFFMLQFLRRTFGYYNLICYCYVNLLNKKWLSKIVSNHIFHFLQISNTTKKRIILLFILILYHILFISFLGKLLLILYRERTFSLITIVMELSRDLKTNYAFWYMMHNEFRYTHTSTYSKSHIHTYDNTQNRLINDFYKVNGRKKVRMFVCHIWKI